MLKQAQLCGSTLSALKHEAKNTRGAEIKEKKAAYIEVVAIFLLCLIGRVLAHLASSESPFLIF